jgi:hypothetical protein
MKDDRLYLIHIAECIQRIEPDLKAKVAAILEAAG